MSWERRLRDGTSSPPSPTHRRVDEGRKLAAGFTAAASGAAALDEGRRGKIEYREVAEGLVGHGMAKTCPVALEAALSTLGLSASDNCSAL